MTATVPSRARVPNHSDDWALPTRSKDTSSHHGVLESPSYVTVPIMATTKNVTPGQGGSTGSARSQPRRTSLPSSVRPNGPMLLSSR